ncbi:MAG: hypothetical protein IKR34_06945 [Candidatus Gastranaerophilales bacterium]|nr:hypothetical protein [Candidatus Gastranaerophilales bacterium]
MKKDKKLAFAISETLITLTIIAVLSVISIIVLHDGRSRKEKINKVLSVTLSHNFDTVYEALLVTECKKKYDIRTMKDINKDNSIDAKDIRSYLISAYMGEPAEECSGLILPEDFNLNKNVSCVDLSPNGFAAIYYDNTCTTTVDAIEDIEHENRIINNTCGYIVYSVKNSKGIKGKDFFVYPFTKKTHDKRTVAGKAIEY